MLRTPDDIELLPQVGGLPQDSKFASESARGSGLVLDLTKPGFSIASAVVRMKVA